MNTLFIIISLLGIVRYVSGQVANRATIERINRIIEKINSLSGEAKAQEVARLYYLLQEELKKPKYRNGILGSNNVPTTTTTKGNRNLF